MWLLTINNKKIFRNMVFFDMDAEFYSNLDISFFRNIQQFITHWLFFV
ncbi:protein of unknown function [Xenorhabdus bovienii]|uniref:Uncharacterized protein n=1 Tax=Xenorhabdus bovienii TaxID=40576 RepID=A0A0B6X8E3_XENBV|nr:protein of unknown function [Xenorhabdus bovienii]